MHTTTSMTTAGCVAALLMLSTTALAQPVPNVIIGADNNSADNPFIQPQDDALAGGGRDQTMQFGDVLIGTSKRDLIIGRLGTDILAGSRGNDVLVGGLEHFNPLNRDRAFGGRGNDVFVWNPGDGSDRFDGGRGIDAVVFGLVGEPGAGGEVEFGVKTDQLAGEVAIDPVTGLPLVNVTNSPGFCPIIDASSTTDAGGQPVADAAAELAALDADHLVQFVIRGIRNAFEAGEQTADNGLRVTVQLKNVEVLVCASEEVDDDGADILIYDLTVSPPVLIDIDQIQRKGLRTHLEDMLL